MRNGFSLVETLVAVAIASIVGAAMWVLINNALGSSNYFMDRQELEEAVRQVQFILMREEECPQNIRGPGDTAIQFGVGQRVPVEIVKNRMSSAEESVLLQSNSSFGRIQIGQMSLEETTQNAEHPVEIFYENGAAVRYDVFFVSLNIPASTRSGRPMDRRQVPLKIFVPQSPAIPEIRKCYIRQVDNQTCGSFGGRFNEATGTCDMPRCAADTVDPTEDCPTTTWTCSERIYFWGYSNDPTSDSAGPRCLCTQSCQPPPRRGGY